MMNQSMRLGYIKKNTPMGFTVVELLVVIMIIAILAIITLVGYPTISQRAVVSSLKSDLNEASKILKIHPFGLGNGNYPTTISTNCSTSPDSATNVCLKKTGSNTFVGYAANNLSTPKTFLLIASNGTNVYKVTDNSPPTVINNTMQPGVTPGAIMELHGAKANGGTSQGINSPLTTTWSDTSGNSNNGTLLNFSGSPWSGAGTVANPYSLAFTVGTQRISTTGLTIVGSKNFTYESWFKTTDASATNRVLIGEDAAGGAPLITLMLASGHQPTIYWWGPGWSGDAAIFGSTSGAMNNGTWHHAVATADGTRLRLYVDNVEQSDGNNSYNLAAASAAGTTQTSVGAYGSGAYLPGSIAVSRIYPFGLTAAQVTTNYNAGPDW